MIDIINLTKNYGNFKAVDNLNLHIDEGEIFGFVGPNGAGKTTTMKIICGLLKATSGEVKVDGTNVLHGSKKFKSTIGYMPDFFGVYDNLKVSEYLDFYASIYKIKGDEKKKVCDDLLELVNLEHKRDAYVDSLSRGMKQRLCLARSLVHNPKLLILDEPASGMDPRARFEMKEILKTLKTMGKTIIISSHILSELSEICTSVGIIDKGNIVISGSIEEIMMKMYSTRVLKLKVSDKIDEAFMILKEFPSIGDITRGTNIIEASFKGNDKEMSDILYRLVVRGIPVISFAEVDGNLEQVFMKVTGEGEEQ